MILCITGCGTNSTSEETAKTESTETVSVSSSSTDDVEDQSLEEVYNSGYEAGYQAALKELSSKGTYDEGYSAGYQKGAADNKPDKTYDDGYTDGSKDTAENVFQDILTSMASSSCYIINDYTISVDNNNMVSWSYEYTSYTKNYSDGYYEGTADVLSNIKSDCIYNSRYIYLYDYAISRNSDGSTHWNSYYDYINR